MGIRMSPHLCSSLPRVLVFYKNILCLIIRTLKRTFCIWITFGKGNPSPLVRIFKGRDYGCVALRIFSTSLFPISEWLFHPLQHDVKNSVGQVRVTLGTINISDCFCENSFFFNKVNIIPVNDKFRCEIIALASEYICYEYPLEVFACRYEYEMRARPRQHFM